MSADLGIRHSAASFLELHGGKAVSEAGKMAAAMHERGDLDSADTWLRQQHVEWMGPPELTRRHQP